MPLEYEVAQSSIKDAMAGLDSSAEEDLEDLEQLQTNIGYQQFQEAGPTHEQLLKGTPGAGRIVGGKSLEEQVAETWRQAPPKFLKVLPSWFSDEKKRLSLALKRAPNEQTQKMLEDEIFMLDAEIEIQQQDRDEAHKAFKESGLSPGEYAERKFIEDHDSGGSDFFTGTLEAVLDTVFLDRAATLAEFVGADEASRSAYQVADRKAAVRALANKYSDWGGVWDFTVGRMIDEKEFRDYTQGILSSAAKFASAAPAGPYGVIADATATSYARALYDAEKMGVKGSDRFMYAAMAATVEGGTTLLFNKIGLGGLEDVKKWGFDKSILRAFAEEFPEEMTQEWAKNFLDEIFGIEDVTSEEMDRRFWATAVQTFGVTSLIQGYRNRSRKFMSDQEDPEKRIYNLVGLEEAREKVRQRGPGEGGETFEDFQQSLDFLTPEGSQEPQGLLPGPGGPVAGTEGLALEDRRFLSDRRSMVFDPNVKLALPKPTTRALSTETEPGRPLLPEFSSRTPSKVEFEKKTGIMGTNRKQRAVFASKVRQLKQAKSFAPESAPVYESNPERVIGITSKMITDPMEEGADQLKYDAIYEPTLEDLEQLTPEESLRKSRGFGPEAPAPAATEQQVDRGRIPEQGDTLEQAIEGLELTEEQSSLWGKLKGVLSSQSRGMPTLAVTAEPDPAKVEKLGGKYGGLYSSDHTVTLVTGQAQGRMAQILLHEAFHAATSKAVQGIHGKELTGPAKEAFQRLEEVLAEVQKALGADTQHYGLKNVAELIAESFNPEFANVLADIKLGDRSLLTRLVEAIKGLLGLDTISNTALEEVLVQGTRLMQSDITENQEAFADTDDMVAGWMPSLNFRSRAASIQAKMKGRPQRTVDVPLPQDPTDPQVAERAKEAMRVDKPNWFRQLMAHTRTTLRQTNPQPELGPRTKTAAWLQGKGGPHLEHLRNWFREFGNLTEKSVRKATERLDHTLRPLNEDVSTFNHEEMLIRQAEYELFEAVLTARDQVAGITQGWALSFGMTPDVARQWKSDLEAKVLQHPRVVEALQRRAYHHKQLLNAAVKVKLLDKDVKKHEYKDYFRREIRAYMFEKGYGAGQTSRMTKRGFQMKRQVHEGVTTELDPEKDVVMDYLLAESIWMADLELQLGKRDLLDKLESWSEDIYKPDVQLKMTQAGISEEEAMEQLGLVEHPIDRHSIFFPVTTISEKVEKQLNELLQRDLKPSDLGLTSLQTKEILRELYVATKVVIPKEMAAELESRDTRSHLTVKGHEVFPIFQHMSNAWKQYTLMNPTRVIGYNVRNIIGDGSAMIGAMPFNQSFKSRIEDVREVYRYIKKPGDVSQPGKYSQDLLDALELSVLSTNSMRDLSTLMETPGLRKFKEKNVLNPQEGVEFYFSMTRGASNFRESVERFTTFRSYLKEFRKKDADPNHVIDFGGSPKDAIMQIYETEGAAAAAAQMTKDLLIDYSDTSEVGQWLASTLIPFWRFAGGNIARWPSLEWNTFQRMIDKNEELQGKGKTKARARAQAGTLALITLARRHAVFTSLILWNKLMFPEDERNLPDHDRWNSPILLGRTSDDKIRLLRNASAFGDLIELAGIPTLFEGFFDWGEGQITGSEILWMTGRSLQQKYFSMIGPAKLPIEMAMGADLPTGRTRTVLDLTGNTLGMPDLMRKIEGTVLGSGRRSRDGFPSWEYFQRAFPGLVDPRKSALYETYDSINKFQKMKGKEPGGSRSISKWRNVRESLHVEDYTAFKEVLDYRFRNGGSSQAWKTFLSTLDPVQGVAIKDRREFGEFLTPDGQRRLNIATDYSAELKRRARVYFSRAVKEGFRFPN